MSDLTSPRVSVPGSERSMPPGASMRPCADVGALVRVTVTLRARGSAAVRTAGAPIDRASFAATFGADRNDALAVERFASAHDLLVLEASLAKRSIELEGTVAQMNAAFGVSLHDVESPAGPFRGRTGPVTIPGELDGIVTGVFGLDSRPVATPKFRLRETTVAHAASPGVSYTPLQLATAYDFPTGVDGTGQTIALIELGGGYTTDDLQTYFTGLGVTPPSVIAVPVGNGGNAPTGDPSGPDTEVMLDIEVAGAVAPGATIVVYFADNTDAGFLSAVTTAIHDTTHAPQIVSISWGGPESTWTAQARTNFDAAFADAVALGISVYVAAGDNGSTDGLTDGAQHVDFPAASPNVVACGGTKLVERAASHVETVWNDGGGNGATGGGVSDNFPLPPFQTSAGVPVSVNPGAFAGRGVPDVAANADPATGYAVRSDGSDTVVGGTSAVAPLYAGLTALINQSRGVPLGNPNAFFYANPSLFTDITSGSNGAYDAAKGWDACTGLGSPRGAALLAALGPGAAPAPAPPSAPTPAPAPAPAPAPSPQG